MELSGTRRLTDEILAQIAESVKKSSLKKRKSSAREAAGSIKAPQTSNVTSGPVTIVLEDEQPVSSSLPTAKKFLAQQQFGKRHKRVSLLTYQAQKYCKQPAKNFKRTSKN